MEAARVNSPIDETIAVLLSAGFDDQTIARLIAMRRHLYERRFTELTREAGYLQFVKWLYARGRMGS